MAENKSKNDQSQTDESTPKNNSPIIKLNVIDFLKGGKGQWKIALIISAIVLVIVIFVIFSSWILGIMSMVFSLGEPRINIERGSNYTINYPTSIDEDMVDENGHSIGSGTSITASCINNWIKKKVPNSPLKTLGQVFVSAGKTYGVNPALMVAIAFQESNLGTRGGGPKVYNPFGWLKAVKQRSRTVYEFIKFKSYEESINTVTSKMKSSYINQGYDTIAKIQKKWAPLNARNDPKKLNRYWADGVTKAFNSLTDFCPTLSSPEKTSHFSEVDIKNLSSWYYNQGAKRAGGGYWGNKKNQCKGWAKHGSRNHKYSYYRESGCGITSMAMIARYYGKNLDPYQMGTEVCKSGTILLGRRNIASTMKRVLGKKTYEVYRGNGLSVEQIKKALKNGPLLAVGDPAFGSKHKHFVVIVGTSGDNFIINDPSSSSRGRAGRQVPFSQRGKIEAVYYFK